MRFLIIILLFSKAVSQDIGQKMIDNGDYESALNYYQFLLNEENLSKDDIIYNLAKLYSSIDSLKKAEEFFDYAMQDSLNPSSELSYNRGNLLYRSKMLDESLKSYREALLKNPEDNDARKNYEFVKNEIEKNQQAQQQNQDQDDNSEDSENNENNQNEDKNQQNKNTITSQLNPSTSLNHIGLKTKNNIMLTSWNNQTTECIIHTEMRHFNLIDICLPTMWIVHLRKDCKSSR